MGYEHFWFKYIGNKAREMGEYHVSTSFAKFLNFENVHICNMKYYSSIEYTSGTPCSSEKKKSKKILFNLLWINSGEFGLVKFGWPSVVNMPKIPNLSFKVWPSPADMYRGLVSV